MRFKKTFLALALWGLLAALVFPSFTTGHGGYIGTNLLRLISSLIPSVDDLFDVGSATFQFRNGYFDGTLEADVLTEGGTAVPNTGDNLSVFAATSSAQLLALLSDPTGTGLDVFSIDPIFQALTGNALCIGLNADAGEDDADKWRICINDSGNFDIESYSTGSWVDILQLGNDGSLISGASALPTVVFSDSGNPGTDKEIAKIVANFLSGGDGAEDGSLMFYAMLAGSEIEWLKWDSDTEAVTLGDSGTGEDLIFDFETATDNQVEVSSNSGVTELSLSGIQFVTTGDIMGAINVSSKAGAYTIGTDDVHESYGTLFTNSNVADLTLAGTTAVVGMSGCLMQEAGVTGIMQLEPGTGSHLVYGGVEKTDGAPLASTGAATDRICWVAISADHWLITASTGTWAE